MEYYIEAVFLKIVSLLQGRNVSMNLYGTSNANTDLFIAKLG